MTVFYSKLKGGVKRRIITHRKSYLTLGLILFFIIAFSAGAITGYHYFKQGQQKIVQRAESEEVEKNAYIEFSVEIYDKIKENYWDKISDEQLSNLFKLGTEKLTNKPQTLKSQNKEGIKTLLTQITKEMDEQKKKEFVASLGDIVLANLNPFSRSRLYTTKLETELKNTVQNIDPNVNLYETLGVNKNASQDEIEKAYQEKSRELSKDESLEAQKKLTEIDRAHEALSKPEKRESYDKSGIEPTIISKLVRPNIFYIGIKKFSPTTFDEFKKAADAVDKLSGELNSLILDLRGNIGGSVDLLPYFLGPFIGQNQYAYEFFHQGEYKPFKTLTGWLPSLVRYKKVVTLIDGGTQSSAELMAATLKKYNVGILVGTRTKGWGTIERIFPIEQQIDPNEQYTMLLAHSLTLRDDGQPIEGKGVDPVININDPDWEKQLFAYFNYQELTDAVKEILEQK